MSTNGVRLKALIPAIAWTLLILVSLSVPGQYVPQNALLTFDKVGHTILFFGLTFFWMRALEAHNLRLILLVLFCGMIFAPLTEVYQGLVAAGRQADLWDSLADIVGFALGTIAWVLVDRFIRRQPAAVE